jgi:hypothetical protein
MWKVIMGMLGLVAAAFAVLMGIGGAGGGHGWIGALWFSLPLLILYPLVFVRSVSSSEEPLDYDIAVLAVAGVLDLLLAANMAAEQEYVRKLWNLDPSGMTTWLALWGGWQIVGVTTLVRKRWRRLGAKAARS